MRTVIGVVLFCLLLISGAQAGVSVTILKGAARGPDEAVLFVSVVDDAGRPIHDLSAENFDLLVGGVAVPNPEVAPVSTTGEALSVVLGVDVSGSMAGRPFEETQRGLSVLLDQLDRSDFVSLMSFGTEVVFLTEFTHERHIVRDEAASLRPVDMWTHLHDALYAAAERARDAPTTRSAVVLLTDGRDEGSGRTRSEALDIARGAAAPIYAIGFGHEIDVSLLEAIASESGGRFLSTPDPAAIAGLYERVAEELQNQYMITFGFDREPGVYMARVSVRHGGASESDGREFLYAVDAQPPAAGVNPRIQIVILLAVVAVIVMVLIAIMKPGRGGDREWLRDVVAELERLRPDGERGECALEYPGDGESVAEYVTTHSREETSLASEADDAYLSVDCLGDRLIPLVRSGRGVIRELIVARRPSSGAVERAPGAVYLWAAAKTISRPDSTRPGHARVVYLVDSERFALEDLGGENPVDVNGTRIDPGTQMPLRDGDVVRIGGSVGVRLVYREGALAAAGDVDGTVFLGDAGD